MIISHKHRFVFVAIPKTGTSSIESVLGNYGEPCNHPVLRRGRLFTGKHELLSTRSLELDIVGYFSFCFVRNSWAKVFSEYTYRKKMLKYWKENPPTNPVWIESYKMYTKALEGCNTFCDFLRNRKYWEPEQLTWSSEVDLVGRFENLQEDFNVVCDKIGIPRQELLHRNKSTHKHYTEYYDDETREIVAEKYAKDIEYFGYEFGE